MYLIKVMRSKYGGQCDCTTKIKQGEEMGYSGGRKPVTRCMDCVDKLVRKHSPVRIRQFLKFDQRID